MMQMLLKTLSLAIICAAVRVQSACLQGCQCNATLLACSGAGAGLGGTLERAVLAPHGDELTEISWRNSNITILENGLFAGLHSLEYIDFSSNQIKRTEHGLFARLARLTYLNISWNEIEDISRFTFADLESLEVLDISHNHLREIPFQVFGPMVKLQHLDISYNQIASFSDYYFNGNVQLKKLLLNDNYNLVRITPNSLVNLKELEILDISSNLLDIVSPGLFKNLKNLKWLKLSTNRLQDLPPTLFRHNEHLETIFLEHTEIRTIKNKVFKGLHNLRRVYITNNEYLREIESFVFLDTPSLTHLDISGNSMHNLPISLQLLENLQELNISENPWACDCRMTWFANWVESRIYIIVSDLTCSLSYPNNMLNILNHTNCTY